VRLVLHAAGPPQLPLVKRSLIGTVLRERQLARRPEPVTRRAIRPSARTWWAAASGPTRAPTKHGRSAATSSLSGLLISPRNRRSRRPVAA